MDRGIRFLPGEGVGVLVREVSFFTRRGAPENWGGGIRYFVSDQKGGSKYFFKLKRGDHLYFLKK